jgi:hypothetical protein
MSALAYRVGEAPRGMPLMKFTLTYDGPLPSTGNGSKKTESKWKLRKFFHPQLEELWATHPAVRDMREGFYFRTDRDGISMTYSHHDFDNLHPRVRTPQPGDVDLCAPIQKGNRLFKPLVRNSFAVSCTLKILFLRKEMPGKVYQGGDLDNRLKTLLDALSVPAHREQIMNDPSIDDPILCLVEDDALITGLSINTDRLLSRPNAHPSDVRMDIEVDVRVTDARPYNATFLGD